VISPTLKKLRYRVGARICVLGAPTAFEAELARADEVHRAEKLGRGMDLIQAFFTRRSHLDRDKAQLAAALADNGILWVCYPKARGLSTDLNRDVVRRAVVEVGLESVAIVAIDAVWSALRFKRTDAAA
jgi:hypothetical protein